MKVFNSNENKNGSGLMGPYGATHHLNVLQAESKQHGPLLPNMMSLNLTNNSSSNAGNRSTQRPSMQTSQQQPPSAAVERKGLACLSQDRVIASAAANNMMKTGKPSAIN
jgi:hypothetical protein